MKEKVYEVRKIVGSRADPENQQTITGLQRMICSEGAVKESTLEFEKCSATRSQGGVGVGILISNVVNIG